MNAVKTNLKRLRLARKLTQDELAEKLHVVRQTVSSWETGKTTPDVETLTAIAQALEVDVTELIYGPRPVDTMAEQRARRVRGAVCWTVSAMMSGVLAVCWNAILRSFGITGAYLPGSFRVDSIRWLLIWFGALCLPSIACVLAGAASVSVIRIQKPWFVRHTWLRRLLLLLGLSLPLYYFGLSAAAFLQMMDMFPAWADFLSNSYHFLFFYHHPYLLFPSGLLIALGFAEK